jgi:radical SAM protein with 4Fe4S-binding SPASM domain
MIRSFIKPLNALLAGFSFLQGSITGRAVVSGMPVAISVELTNHCNLNCPECNSGSRLMKRERGFMDIVLFDKIVSELNPYLLNLNLYFQGEPMMHPEFFSFLEKCKKINTTVATNGHFLSAGNADKLVRSGLKKLIISLDGMDKATYSLYRVNGDFDTVLEGIRNVSEAKKKSSSPIKVIIQFLVNKNNEHQISQVKHFSGEIKANLKLKSMQIINSDTFEKWLPSIKKFCRYEITEGEYRIKSLFPNRCARLWFNPVITWDGKVVPCCFDKDADHILGDLNEDSFQEIWNGPKYRIFRRSLISGRYLTDICRNCTSGLKGVIY